MKATRCMTTAMIALALGTPFAVTAQDTKAAPPLFPEAHFHHLHLNTTDPKAAIEFYTTKFDAERGRFARRISSRAEDMSLITSASATVT